MFRWRSILVLALICTSAVLIFGGRTSRAQTGNARQLSFPPPGYSDLNCSFSPKGDRLVLARSTIGGSSLTDLYVLDVATGATSVLVTGLPVGWNSSIGFEWSPDGSHITFASNANGPYAIWIVDVPTGRGKP